MGQTPAGPNWTGGQPCAYHPAAFGKGAKAGINGVQVAIEEFSYFRSDDPCDLSYPAEGNPWSRPYEYKWALDRSLAEKGRNGPGRPTQALNAAWGFSGCHVAFRERLDESFEAIHTDAFIDARFIPIQIQAYNRYPTFIQDITQGYKGFLNKFDVVMCVSVLEHLPMPLAKAAIANFVSYARVGGAVLITFDIPSESGAMIVAAYGGGRLPDGSPALLDGNTSRLPNPDCAGLNVGRLLLRRLS